MPLGIVKNLDGEVETASKYLNDAIKTLSELNREKDVAQDLAEAYYWMGANLSDLKTYEQSINMHKQALDLRTENAASNPLPVIDSYYCIGIVYFDMGLYEDALKYHSVALEKKLLLHSDLSEEMVENHYWIGMGACFRF